MSAHPDWTTRPLSEVVLPVAKADPAMSGREAFRYVDIGSVDGASHRIVDANWTPSASAPGRARQLVHTGDTLFSTVRPYLEKIAYIAEALDGEIASTGFCVLRPRQGIIEPRFLFHYMTSQPLLDQVLPLQRGVSYPAVRDKDVVAAKVPVPPLDEQQRIVDILEDHISRLDAATDGLSRATTRAGALVAASAAAQISSLPTSLRRSTVGEHALLVEYGTSTKTTPVFGPGSIPVLRMGNIKDGQIDWATLKYLPPTHHEFPRLLLQRGDLLFNRTNSAEHVGKCAVFEADGPTSFASYLIRVRFDGSVLPEWANLAINSPQGRDYVAAVVSQQVGQANVNGTKLRSFPLPVPSIPEQRSRVRAHRAVVEGRSALLLELSRAERRSERLRQSLLSAAFSGRLTGRSSDLDRAEEMASA